VSTVGVSTVGVGTRHVRPVVLVVVGALLALVVGALPAAAHDVLTGTSPATGTTVDRTPGAVVLTFDQPVVGLGTQVLVTGPSGEVHAGAARAVDNTVTQDLQGGAAAGAYTVAWRVTSADGHPVTGTFTFTSEATGTGQAPPPGATSPATGPAAGTSAPGVAVRASVGLLVVAAVGAVVVLARRRAAAG